MNIVLEGQECTLLPQRALYWPTAGTLFIADTHFGKADSFRSRGIPVPEGSLDATLSRMTAALRKTRADRLVILGDFWHAQAGVTTSVIETLANWRGQFAQLSIDLILGNHDRFNWDLSSQLQIVVHREALRLPPFFASHYPDRDEAGYVLAGHLHPGFTLRGRARESLTLPCFWLTQYWTVLPSIGSFTGLSTVPAVRGHRVVLVVEDQLTEIPL